jgi:hypothetical protein
MTAVLETIKDTQLDKDFSKYGQKFQLTVLSLLVQDITFANKIKLVLKSEYFDNKFCQFICETTLNFYNEYGCKPEFEDLKSIIETQAGKAAKLYLATLDSIKNTDLSRRSFVETEAEKFCFTRFALQKLEEEKNNILAGKFDTARELGFEKYKPISSASAVLDLKRDISRLFDEKAHSPVPCPLPSFNMVSKGGPGAGCLCVIVAQSNFGKSNYLIATARHAMQLGKKVAFVSLETDSTQLLSRAVAGIVGMNQEYLKDHPGLIHKKIEEVSGDIRFIELKATTARVDVIKMQIEELKAEGFFPELVIIDGLNQVKLPLNMKHLAGNSNDKFEYLAEEIRDMAKELSLPVYVAFQANRGGFNVEFADEQNIGKAIEVYQVADWMVLFTQSLPMQESGECYAQLLKNRLGPKGMTLRLKYDPNRVLFTELESVDRSLLLDKKARASISKGLDTMKERLDKYKQP